MNFLAAVFAVITVIAFAFLVWFALTAIGAAILMLVWNISVPIVFGGPYIDFWPAFGLTALVKFVGGAFRSAPVSKN